MTRSEKLVWLRKSYKLKRHTPLNPTSGLPWLEASASASRGPSSSNKVPQEGDMLTLKQTAASSNSAIESVSCGLPSKIPRPVKAKTRVHTILNDEQLWLTYWKNESGKRINEVSTNDASASVSQDTDKVLAKAEPCTDHSACGLAYEARLSTCKLSQVVEGLSEILNVFRLRSGYNRPRSTSTINDQTSSILLEEVSQFQNREHVRLTLLRFQTRHPDRSDMVTEDLYAIVTEAAKEVFGDGADTDFVADQ